VIRKPAAILFVLSAAALALALVPAAGLAAKGGNSGKPGGGGNGGGGGSTSSLSLVMVADANANGAPNWGDTVTFNVSTTATAEPSVNLTCSQAGALVYSGSAGFYPGYPWPWAQNFGLRSGAWTGGAAACTAELYYWNGRRFITLTSLSFRADA